MENYNLTQTGAEVQRILNSVQTIDATPTASSDNPVKSGGVKTALDTIVSNLQNGTLPAALAENLANWEDRDELSVEDVFTSAVVTTGGSQSIDSSKPASLASIIAKSDFYASTLKSTGFNLLRNAVQVGDGYYFLVPALPFGSYGTAEQPNGILFTNSEGTNLQPTVYFKPLSSGVPTTVTDGDACAYTDSNGYRFFTTTQAGYMIVSGITLASTCAHIGWSRRYNEYISVSDSNDAGSTISLASIISAVHNYNLLLTAGHGGATVADSIVFGESAATWYRRVDRVQPSWTTVADEVEEGATQTYTHSATISGMKSGGTVECGNLALSVDGTTISYQDTSSSATSDYVKYELATIVTGSVSISPSLAAEDWGLIILESSTGAAYVTINYAQGYPDAVAQIVNSKLASSLQVVVEAIAEIYADIQGLKDQLNAAGNVSGLTFDAENGYYIMGQKMFDVVTGAPTELPKSVGLIRLVGSTGALYMSKSVTNSASDWQLIS